MKLIHVNTEVEACHAVEFVSAHQWTDGVGIMIQTNDGDGIYRLTLSDKDALTLASRLTWLVSQHVR